MPETTEKRSTVRRIDGSTTRVSLWVAAALLSAPVLSDAPPGHDKAYWQAIAEAEYAVPEGADAFELVLELIGQLGSTDSELRDTYGYTIPAVWIYREQLLSKDQLREVTRLLISNLQVDVGETGTDSVLLRSFSALDLSVLAALDNRAPFLGEKGFTGILDATLGYLEAERDLRGFVPGKGWHHSTAHTADVLKFLGRSRHLQPAGQKRILEGIAAKFAVSGVYTHGEDERLARAVHSLVRREDFAWEAFEAWIDGFVAEAKAIWETPALDPERYESVQNAKNLMRSLLVSVSGDEPTENEQRVAKKLLEALQSI